VDKLLNGRIDEPSKLTILQMLADLALEVKCPVFVYSSALQPTPKPDYAPEYSRISKKAIESHCRQLGELGLNWM
jgi:hypothetical protein